MSQPTQPPQLVPLARHAPDTVVAFGPDGVRTAADLLQDAAAIAARLPEPR